MLEMEQIATTPVLRCILITILSNFWNFSWNALDSSVELCNEFTLARRVLLRDVSICKSKYFISFWGRNKTLMSGKTSMKMQNNTVPEICTLLLKYLLWSEGSGSEAVQ